MTSLDPLRDSASAIVDDAAAFHRAAETPGGHVAAPEFLASLQEALQVLSAAWYRLAADAAPHNTAEQKRGLSREQEVRLMGALHDVAAALARGARACREGQSTIASVIARSTHVGRPAAGIPDGDLSWFASARPPTQRVA